jgi:hypothetical protein
VNASACKDRSQVCGASLRLRQRRRLVGAFEPARGQYRNSGERERAIEVGAHGFEPVGIPDVSLRLHRLANEGQYGNTVLFAVLAFRESVVEPHTLRHIR